MYTWKSYCGPKKWVLFFSSNMRYAPFQPWLTLSQDLARPQPLKSTLSYVSWRKDLGQKRVHNLKTNLGHSWTLPAGLCLCGRSIATVLKTLDSDHYCFFAYLPKLLSRILYFSFPRSCCSTCSRDFVVRGGSCRRQRVLPRDDNMQLSRPNGPFGGNNYKLE